MRRSERAITDPAELESILREALVCRMGLCDGEVPYVVPMNYGYRDGSVFPPLRHRRKKNRTSAKEPERVPGVREGRRTGSRRSGM